MPPRRPSPMRQLAAAAVLLLAAAVAVLLVVTPSSTPPPAARTLESVFQDDNHLVYASSVTVARTLDTLRTLGVDTIRVTILWRAVAPQPGASSAPSGFDASNPADYPAGVWAPYDRLLRLAQPRGIRADFNVTAPGPLWAMAPGAPSARYADHWAPAASQFGQFVTALGTRYSGSYRAGGGAVLPRVSYWSLWNEPNQPGWLAPQWRGSGAQARIESAVLYRDYVRAAFAALGRTGHGPANDTLLVGELAPEGCEAGSPCSYQPAEHPIPPMPFLRALYCVDDGYQPLRGATAAALSCPVAGGPGAFVSANPGLFDATGFAHHPYSFFLAPAVGMSDPNFVPLSDLHRIEQGLDVIFRSYGVKRQLPLYLTEYGYETNPPNPFRGVSPEIQALYLDQAQYLAWRDPRVRAMSQFLLYDSPPDTRYRPGTQAYWSTFQTGLLDADGAVKPSFASYRLPIFLPQPVLDAGRRVFVWGMIRAARHRHPQTAQLQWAAPGSSYRTVSTLTSNDPNGVVAARVRLPGPGSVRIAWRSPSGGELYSRAALVSGAH